MLRVNLQWENSIATIVRGVRKNQRKKTSRNESRKIIFKKINYFESDSGGRES